MIDTTADFFDLDDFAEMITMNNRSMKAMFDRVPVEHQEGYATISGYAPTLTVQTVDVTASNAVQGSPVVVRGKNYEVADIQEDGTGISTVHLYKK